MGRSVSAEEYCEALWDDEALTLLTLRLAEVFGARSAHFQWRHHDGNAQILAHSGHFTDAQLQVYAAEFAAIDPWAIATEGPEWLNVATNLEEIVPVTEFTRTPFYNEFLRRIGDDTCRCIGIRIHNRWGSGIVAFQQGRSARPFDDEAIALLTREGAPMRRLLAARGKVAALERNNATFVSMLDHVPQATLLVRYDGRILSANAAAEALLREGSVLAARSGRLEVRGRQSQQLHGALVHAATCGEPAMSSHLIDRAPAAPWIATVLPVKQPEGGRQALLLVQELTPGSDAVQDRLTQLFNLTAAEAAVAMLIAQGIAPNDIARQRGVSITTVRTQIRAIIAKLRCSRQAEVVAIVQGIASLPGG